MELLESIRTQSFIILSFYLFLKYCKYKKIIFSFTDDNKTDAVLVFTIFIIYEALIMKLFKTINGYILYGVFIIASGYYSGVLYGFVTLLISSFIIIFLPVDLGIKAMLPLGAASAACSILYKKTGSSFSSAAKIMICCSLSALIKFLLYELFFHIELPELLQVFFLDCIGSVLVIYIIGEYILENRNEGEKTKILEKLRFLTYQNRKFKDNIKTEYKFNKMRYASGFIIEALDRLLELCRKDTYKAREMIESIRIFVYESDKYHTGMIKLDNELNLLNSYINIIRLKYDEKIAVYLKIHGDTSKCCLPAMIIQPVVENSILHGIYPKAFGGEVFVNIDISDEKIKIEVKDTGIGIDSETVENIFKDNNKSLGAIYKRLNNTYKENFKLIITSRIEDGTTVIMELPSKKYYIPGNSDS